MADDGTLLKRYEEAGSEEAFTELVNRHLDLVYSAALRSLGGDVHLARDVSQTVFIALARKASALTNRMELTGWLYTSACFAAAKAVRSQHRRRVREQAAEAMREFSANPTQEPDWHHIRPVLESLMLDLKETDREALLLRFFQRHSLAEVGRKLGLTENAARMRVDRALEKLRLLLARRGIDSTSTALAMVITQQAVVAAPAGLAPAIAATTFAGAASHSTLSILHLVTLMKKSTIILGLLIAFGVTSLYLQHRTNLRLKDEIASLHAQMAQLPAAQPASEASSDAEPEQFQPDKAELIRLRGEVAGLRRDKAELMRLRGEVGELRRRLATASTADETQDRSRSARKANAQKEAKALLAKSPEIPLVPADKWVNAGFASPEAALQTLNWSMANHDTNAYGNSLMWDAQAKARADALFADAPDSIKQAYGDADNFLVGWWLNNSASVTATRVLSQTQNDANTTSLVQQSVYKDGSVHENTVQFQRDANGQWRQVIPPKGVPESFVVFDNATPPNAGGGN